jgi:hypothetical protein
VLYFFVSNIPHPLPTPAPRSGPRAKMCGCQYKGGQRKFPTNDRVSKGSSGLRCSHAGALVSWNKMLLQLWSGQGSWGHQGCKALTNNHCRLKQSGQQSPRTEAVPGALLENCSHDDSDNTNSQHSLNLTVSQALIFFLCGGRVLTWHLSLARQMLYHLSHTPSPFCFSYFSDRVSCFSQGVLRP